MVFYYIGGDHSPVYACASEKVKVALEKVLSENFFNVRATVIDTPSMRIDFHGPIIENQKVIDIFIGEEQYSLYPQHLTNLFQAINSGGDIKNTNELLFIRSKNGIIYTLAIETARAIKEVLKKNIDEWSAMEKFYLDKLSHSPFQINLNMDKKNVN